MTLNMAKVFKNEICYFIKGFGLIFDPSVDQSVGRRLNLAQLRGI